VFAGTEAAERARRDGNRSLSRPFVGSLGAGTGPPINLDGNGGPEPKALFASFRAAIKGLLPGCCEPDCTGRVVQVTEGRGVSHDTGIHRRKLP
jgi:hypothetical protein